MIELETLNKTANRTFETEEDFIKHYENLVTFIGKKKEDYEKEIKPEFDKLMTEEKQKVEDTIKPIRDWMKDAGIEDVNKVNPFEIKEVIKSLTSKTDVAPVAIPVDSKEQRINDLKNQVLKTGNADTKEQLVAELFSK